ncbi:MAG: hypothetical protein E7609_00275 [Ruminococcaceae bacterium]|nr:hypothetical protein [Oscillospiraceae bacterium]
MFFLLLDWSYVIPSALLGMMLALVALAIFLFVLQLFGFRLLWRKRGLSRRERMKSPTAVNEAPTENEISEEELIVLITAAAAEALGGIDTKRFRVVSFRRI